MVVFPGRQLLALNRQTRILGRLYSTGTPVDTAVQTPPQEVENEPESPLGVSNLDGVRSAAQEAWDNQQSQSKHGHDRAIGVVCVKYSQLTRIIQRNTSTILVVT